ncbi:unnamed protein product [Meganyctiphanes norvegica]|uniref:PNT domain-containing protein n=1 Tax=Meganyctiphanes norvegica TaxID=48144 RepID=A0AAV2RGB7_MEGNR
MSSSTLPELGYGCDLDLIRDLGQYCDDFCHTQSTDISHEEQNFSVNVPIEQWNGEDCMSWVLSTCHRRGVDMFSIDLGLLSNTSGVLLLQFSKQDFCQVMGDTLGRLIHKELQELKGEQSKMSYIINMIPKLDLNESYGSSNFPNDNYNSYNNEIQYYNVDQENCITNGETYGPYHTHGSPGCTSLPNTMDSYNDEISNSSDGSQGSYSYEESPCYNSDESMLGIIDDLVNIYTKDLMRLDSYEAKRAY